MLTAFWFYVGFVAGAALVAAVWYAGEQKYLERAFEDMEFADIPPDWLRKGAAVG